MICFTYTVFPRFYAQLVFQFGCSLTHSAASAVVANAIFRGVLVFNKKGNKFIFN
jgi:hypothetical protein